MLSDKYSRILINIFFFLFPFYTFNSVNNIYLNIFGRISILIMLFLSFFMLISIIITNKYIRLKYIKLLSYYFCFFIILFIGIFKNFSVRAIIVFSQFVLLMSFFFLFSKLNYCYKIFNKKIIYFNFFVYFILSYSGLFINFTDNINYKSLYGNSNVFGMVSFFYFLLSVFFYNIFLEKKYIIFTFLSFFMIYISGTRSSLILSFLFFLIYKLIIFCSEKEIRWKSFFVILIVSIIVFVSYYPFLDEIDGFYKINSYIFSITGKNILSGRNFIWKNLIRVISEKKFFGYGTGALLSDLTEISVSSHNLYLQILLQNGIFGLMFFIILLFNIWKFYYNYSDDTIVRFVASVFICILIQNMFEVILTQNNLGLSIIQWFFISVGISKAYRQINNNIKEI